eukprot:126195-Chlamydomonas_euryale.AAC.3
MNVGNGINGWGPPVTVFIGSRPAQPERGRCFSAVPARSCQVAVPTVEEAALTVGVERQN